MSLVIIGGYYSSRFRYGAFYCTVLDFFVEYLILSLIISNFKIILLLFDIYIQFMFNIDYRVARKIKITLRSEAYFFLISPERSEGLYFYAAQIN